ncbi:hypothetical protein EON81_00005, partial [bacterium]
MPIPFLPVLALAFQAPSLDFAFQPSGIVEKVGGYAPYGLKLSPVKPEAVKKTPEVASPQYGTVKIGRYGFLVLLDGKDKLYVDSNANGDLTDDPATIWSEKTYKTSTGEAKSFQGFATVDLTYGGKTIPSRIGVYSAEPGALGYYQDFALAGKITLGAKTYNAILADGSAEFDLAGTENLHELLLLLDKDG